MKNITPGSPKRRLVKMLKKQGRWCRSVAQPWAKKVSRCERGCQGSSIKIQCPKRSIEFKMKKSLKEDYYWMKIWGFSQFSTLNILTNQWVVETLVLFPSCTLHQEVCVILQNLKEDLCNLLFNLLYMLCFK